jgi:nucleoside-diphosphate-sugar epimerase
MKILVTGVSGQVGGALVPALAPLGEIVQADRSVLDLSDPDAVRAGLERIRPDVIVNPAAYTAVDKAETEPDVATRINTHAPGWMAEYARAHGALLVHYSTDYVFDGRKGLDGPAPMRPDPDRIGDPGAAPPLPGGRSGRACERLWTIQAGRRGSDPQRRLPSPDPAHELGVRPARAKLPHHHAPSRA